MKRKLFAWMLAISFAFTNVNSFVFAEEVQEEETEDASEETTAEKTSAEPEESETPEETETVQGNEDLLEQSESSEGLPDTEEMSEPEVSDELSDSVDEEDASETINDDQTDENESPSEKQSNEEIIAEDYPQNEDFTDITEKLVMSGNYTISENNEVSLLLANDNTKSGEAWYPYPIDNDNDTWILFSYTGESTLKLCFTNRLPDDIEFTAENAEISEGITEEGDNQEKQETILEIDGNKISITETGEDEPSVLEVDNLNASEYCVRVHDNTLMFYQNSAVVLEHSLNTASARMYLSFSLSGSGAEEPANNSILLNAVSHFVDKSKVITEEVLNEEQVSEEESYNASASPASDFDYEIYQSMVTLKKYIGNDTKVVIPSKINGYPVVEIWGYAFSGCDNITSITIPGSIKEIGEDAFKDCAGMKELHISSIQNWMNTEMYIDYDGNTNSHPLSDATNGKLYIGENEADEIIIPSKTKEIPSYAFYNCGNITKVTIPGSVEKIGRGAFAGCTGVKELHIDRIEDWVNTELDWDSHPFTDSGGKLYIGNREATFIEIPSNISSIGAYAFVGCENITRITIPSSIEEIGAYAFAYCKRIASIKLPNRLSKINYGTFLGCSSLLSVTIPGSVNEIGVNSFEGCTALKRIQIPNGVSTIRPKAFLDCTGLVSVSIPSSVTEILSFAFENCTQMKELHVDSIESWLNTRIDYRSSPLAYATGGKLFVGNKEAKMLSIPSGVKYISANSFQGCSNITAVRIPSSVTEIGGDAFGDCTGLNAVDIPSSVTKVNAGAFFGCTNLRSVTIPSSITELDYSVFRECKSLETVTIPASVTRINPYAFMTCPKLKNVYFQGACPDIDQHAFYESPNVIFHFPAASKPSSEIISGNTVKVAAEPVRKKRYIYYDNHTKSVGFDFTDVLGTVSSTTYNPDLAQLLLGFALAAYSDDTMYNTLSSFEFRDAKIQHYDDSFTEYGLNGAAYAFAWRKCNGKTLVSVSIRGTKRPVDAMNDLNLFFSEIDGFHTGFMSASRQVYNSLLKYLKDKKINSKDVVFLITGHSKGAGVANLLEYRLLNNGFDTSQIYGYNFSCPDVAKQTSSTFTNKKYNCMFNISHTRDIVSVVPGSVCSTLSAVASAIANHWERVFLAWGKFGVSRWVDYGSYNRLGFKAHTETNNFYNYMASGNARSDAFITRSKIPMKGLSIIVRCPVDVTVTDKEGNKIASVIGNEKELYDSDREDVFVFTDGDQKLVYIVDDEDVNVEMTATDQGDMSLEVIRQNEDGTIDGSTYFTDVSLEPGKEMICEVEPIIEDSELYVVDDSADKTTVIDEDGTESDIEETRVIIGSGYCGFGTAWKLYSDGLLEITGEGPMYDLYDAESADYSKYADLITKVVVKDRVETVGSYSFAGLKNLEAAEIGGLVNSIEEYAFSGCPKLSRIVLNAELTNISENVFEGDTALKEAAFVGSAPERIDNIFSGLTLTCWINDDDTWTEDIRNSASGTVTWNNNKIAENELTGTIKWSVDQCGNLRIEGTGALSGFTDENSVPWRDYQDQITQIVVEEGITSVEDNAFIGTNAEVVMLPASLESFSVYAFGQTTGQAGKVKSISVAEGNQQYQSIDGILYSADGKELIVCPKGMKGRITIPEGTETIADCAFMGNTDILSAMLPETLKTIGASAFEESGLRTVIIPESVENIGENAFASNEYLKSAILTEGITAIESGVFKDCGRLNEVGLPGGLTVIAADAFENVSSLKKVSYGGTMKEWEALANTDRIGSSDTQFIYLEAEEENLFDGPGITSVKAETDGIRITWDSIDETEKYAVFRKIGQKSWMRIDDVTGTEYTDTSAFPGVGYQYAIRCINEDGTVYTSNYGKESALTVFGSNPNKISMEKTTLEMLTSTAEELNLTADTANGNTAATWTSSNEKVAIVDECGTVTALTYGKAVITAVSAVNPSLKTTCTVQTRFWDVDDSTQSYYKPVYWGADNGVVAGYDGGVYFGPDNVCTRAQFVTFLWRLAGKPTGKKTVNFKDVDTSVNYYRAVKWAVSEGIIVGYKDDNTFRPDNEVTRGQVATMLWRFAGRKTPTLPSTSPFSDINASNSSYRAVVWGQKAGVIKGYKDGTFQPDASCLRQHIVTFLYRYARDVMGKKVN